MNAGVERGWIAEEYDSLLLDLDGTVIRGGTAIDGVVEALDRIPLPQLYITNNASKSPVAAAEMLSGHGLSVTADRVVTSAATAVALAAETAGVGTRVLVVGHPSFEDLAREAGFEVVASADYRPEIVFQGLSRELTWAQLAEGCLAIRAGARWVASNADTTLPTERGLLPGNGSLVAALVAATGREPEVAGKPGPAMMLHAAGLVGSSRPLVVGDRLDTDIRGAGAAGMDSAFVLTGVSTLDDALAASPESRPTLLAATVADLMGAGGELRIAGDLGPGTQVRGQVLHADVGELSGLPLARAVLAAAWSAGATGVRGVDESSTSAVAAAGFTVAASDGEPR